MSGLMKWDRPGLFTEGAKVLHVKPEGSNGWLIYKACSFIPQSVKSADTHGFASAQYLLEAGWKYYDA